MGNLLLTESTLSEEEKCQNCVDNIHSNPLFNIIVIILYSILLFGQLFLKIKYYKMLGRTSKFVILLMNLLCLDQLYENAFAMYNYNRWADNFMLFDTTDQVSRELTALVLNIITLRLYQVYEVLNAKSRT